MANAIKTAGKAGATGAIGGFLLGFTPGFIMQLAASSAAGSYDLLVMGGVASIFGGATLAVAGGVIGTVGGLAYGAYRYGFFGDNQNTDSGPPQDHQPAAQAAALPAPTLPG